MKYLVLNLVSREIAFNRNNPTEELLENKLFVHELDQFINAGPKNKTKILMKIKQLIEAKISYLEGELSNLRKNLEKVEKGLIPNSSTIRVCPDCGTRNLHYYVDTNNWCCACC